MHELSIALNILELVGAEAQRRGSPRVHAIHLRLGPLGGVVKDSLQAAYALAREQSPFADCRLEIEDVPLEGYCSACETQRPAVSVQELCCADCGQPLAEIVRGRELEIAALEIDA
jgi:hydrogenase nickel insertion protein HypA